MKKIDIEILNGSTVLYSTKIVFKYCMDIQKALENAYVALQEDGKVVPYYLEYYGFEKSLKDPSTITNEYLGYMVVMMDQIFEDANNNKKYWFVLVDGELINVGIDSYELMESNSKVQFVYETYDATKHKGTHAEVKEKSKGNS